MSLLSSFTIVPWLSSRFGKLEHIEGKNLFGKTILAFEAQLTRFTNWVTNILVWSLANKFKTLGIVVILFFGSLYMVAGGYVGGEFFARSDAGEFLVQIEMPKDASLEQTNFIDAKSGSFS